MKLLSAFPIILLFALVVGCDGDGDGTTTTTETTTQETGAPEETETAVTIDSGTRTVGTKSKSILSDFDIFETGMLEGTVEWSAGPPKIDVSLIHGGGTSEYAPDAGLPVTVMMEVTQALLDNGNSWILEVYNPDTSLEITADFVVRFTPD